jgi:hypothetical protein
MSKEDKSLLGQAIEKKYAYRSKVISSIAVCAMGCFVMWLTKGETGVGWAILGLMFIWG